MATIPTVVPLLTDAWRIYSTSTPQDKQSMGETLSSIIVSYASMRSNRVPNSVLYEQDFFERTRTTAVLLRAGKRDDIDWHTLAEEIESMGASQYDAVSSAVYQILVHLLKWYYQPERRSNSWRASVVEHRNRISRKLRRSPSLVPQIPLMIICVLDTFFHLGWFGPSTRLGPHNTRHLGEVHEVLQAPPQRFRPG